MKETLRSNTIEVQRLTSELLKRGIRVFIEPVRNTNGRKMFVIAFERMLTPDYWGNKFSFKKQVSKDLIEDAYVKTIEHLYKKEIKENNNQ